LVAAYLPGQKLCKLFNDAGFSQSGEALIQWWLLISGTLTVLLLVGGMLLLSLALNLALGAGAFVVLQSRADKRRQNLRAALPDLLDALAQALRAGLSFPQAVRRTMQAETSDSPVADLLQTLHADLTLGCSVAESFERFAKEQEVRELRTIAATLGVVARVGGNAPVLLEQTAGIIRQDLTLNRSLKAQTAQGRMSVRLVGSVPFVLIALMSLVMPGYLGDWFASRVGQVLFGLSLLLLLIGFLWVRKVVDIRV
jgi:tight adherence protein B